MLIGLTIKNYALIKRLEMAPSPGLNVITGETGAGKSIMLGAVGLLLGNRADTRVLGDDAEKCITEGTFDISAYHLQELFESENLDHEAHTVVRREVTPAGKSRAFINDTPVTLETLRRIGGRMMDVHSQHETLELGSRSFQLRFIDTFASNQKIRTAYDVAWAEYVHAKKELETLAGEAEALRKEADFVKFQLEELLGAGVKEEEEEEIESKVKIAEHAEEIKTRFHEAISQMGNSEQSIRTWLTEVRNKLNHVAGYAPSYAQLTQRVDSIRIELDDILDELEQEADKVEFDPKQLAELKDRLSVIYQLMQKHRSKNTRELLQVQESFQTRSDKTSQLDDSLAAAQAHVERATVQLRLVAADLSATRKKAIAPIGRQVTGLLKDLGIPDAQLKIEIDAIEPGPAGADSIEIMFSANKGISPKPLAQVASGGEFSRVMFSMKYVMAEKTALPTLILDEIDNGVSGEIAIRLGKMMKEMSQRHQLIAITHLPQIAAKGDSHYFVYKDNSSEKTVSLIRRLEGQERISEIAKMIGGATPTALAIENAKELIAR